MRKRVRAEGSEEVRKGGGRKREEDKPRGVADNQFPLSHKAQVALFTCVLSRFRWPDRLPVLHLSCVSLLYYSTLLDTLHTLLYLLLDANMICYSNELPSTLC